MFWEVVSWQHVGYCLRLSLTVMLTVMTHSHWQSQTEFRRKSSKQWFHDSMLDTVGFCLRLSLTVMLTVMTHSHWQSQTEFRRKSSKQWCGNGINRAGRGLGLQSHAPKFLLRHRTEWVQDRMSPGQNETWTEQNESRTEWVQDRMRHGQNRMSPRQNESRTEWVKDRTEWVKDRMSLGQNESRTEDEHKPGVQEAGKGFVRQGQSVNWSPCECTNHRKHQGG